MKKLLLCLLALMLAVPALAEGDAAITLTPAGSFSRYAGFEDDCARVVDTSDEGFEGVFDIQGNNIIPCEYGVVNDYGVCDYYTVQNESGVNMVGALNAEGTLVVPMEYGDIDFLSERWAMAVKLEVTDGADYDYEALFGDENYIVTAYDFYDLAAGTMVGTLSRDEMRSAEAYGDYIFVMDHADNVTIYDAAFTAVGSADSLYDAYASSDEGVVYLPTGEVVLPGYRYNSDLGFGLLCVADEDYNYGVVDLEGNIVVPFDEYEYFTEFDINGYARVEKDGLYGLIDLNGACVVPCEYDEIERLAFAGDYVYGLGGYACVEKGGKFGYVSLETGEATCPINYVDPTIVGLSMVAPDITGALYIIAADGTTTPTDYAEVDEYPDGDGSLLLAQNAEGLWGLVDWHGNVLLDFTFDSSYYITISADGAALLVEGEDGMTGYAISGTPATTTPAPAATVEG